MTDHVTDLRCTRCNEKLNPVRTVWLELNNHTNTYHEEGTVPPAQSQGGFSFGQACARRALRGDMGQAR
jgi:hypothetical protein